MTPDSLLFGTDEVVDPPVLLGTGRLTAQLRGTRLGPVCYDGHEVWHGVDFLYRDADWGTPKPVVDASTHRAHDDGFHAELRGHIDAGAARIVFEVAIEARGRTLRYEATAHAERDIHTNRTGVVVMHPLSVCGQPVEVTHVDGRTSASTFPTLIAPWPPFMLVRAIRHIYADGAWASCRFSGDDFELEDQRNNADASFKTYSRSNLMPRPYLLRAGEEIRQSVVLEIESPPAQQHAARPGPVRVSVGAIAGALPLVGTAISIEDVDVPALRTLAPGLLHLTLDAPDQPFDARRVSRLLVDAGGCALRIDIAGVDPTRAAPQLNHIAAALRDAGVVPTVVVAFPSSPPVVEAARHAFPQSRIGGGTPHFFTQLNRIEGLGPVDFISFTTASVVHGADDTEIMAGLRSLPAMVRTVHARHGPVPVHVGPSSIGARHSPLGGQPESDGTRRLALARRDPRTRGLYGAAWALGYIAQLAYAGAEAITLFSLQGDAALVVDGVPTPAFEVMQRLGAPGRCRTVDVSDPETVAALAIERDGRCEVLLANLHHEPVEVALVGNAGLPLDARVSLAPYALAFV
ncbi:hypothetical protein [Variovorax sp. Sphag1AA]|uniref:hypothetical protein n=1 Tax=Variovorax sp. Sphag1AA TaxID=2587027 RepID=UPI001610ACC6|nr:hypothetical protein [Variovorax sp. Sphag1AA]MBB3178395.1 hypothetical protein [Variovorax sp. Sphag1AA]